MLSLCFVGFLGACGPAATPEQAETGEVAQGNRTFTYAISGNPSSTNPIVVGDRFGLTFANMVYSPLGRLNAEGGTEFVLAESMDVSEDGLTITVHLREGVLWSDGEPFTADDVVFTYETRANPDYGNHANLWIGTEQIAAVAVDDHTVEFTLPTVSAAAVNNLLFEVFIMPRHVFAEEPDFAASHLQEHPVGTGPYVLVEFNPGQYLTFEANEHYFGGVPDISNVTLRIIENTDTARLALQSGEVDAAIILPADIPDFDEGAINVFPFSENRVGYIGMNALTPELSDVRVRQAIRYALNPHDMNIAAFQSEEFFNQPLTFLPPNNPWATTNVNTFETNLDRARELLAEAGAENLQINIGFSSMDPAQTAQAALAQAQLAEVGITLTLEGGDAAAISAELMNPESTRFNLFTGGYIMGQDPDGYRSLFTSNAAFNFWNYHNEEIDRLFDAGAVEMDETARFAIYEELQQVISESAIIVPVVDNLRIIAVNNRIGGVKEAGLVPIYTFDDWSRLTIQ